MLIYTVKKGDTLYELAKRFHVSLDVLKRLNAIEDPSVLSVGQALVIPKIHAVHTVAEGETLTSISRKEGVAVKDLLRFNPGITVSCDLKVNDELVLGYENCHSKRITVNGCVTEQIDTDNLLETLPFLSHVSCFSFGFTSTGDLVFPHKDFMTDTMSSHGVTSVMILSSLNSDGQFDNSLSHIILEDCYARDFLISNILTVMIMKQFKTLYLDFQFIFREDSSGLLSFLKSIKEAFAPYGFALWIAVPPISQTHQTGLLYEGFLLEEISTCVDRIIVMTYEWGYRYTNPYAVSPYPELRNIISYMSHKIDPAKLMLGIGTYGYSFSVLPNGERNHQEIISLKDALKLAEEHHAEIRFDETSRSPYFRYFMNRDEYRVVFEDARSFEQKLLLVEEFKLSGISLWNLMSGYHQGLSLLIPYMIR